jgi:type II secretory pathway component GspD/PulD (secretin)
VRWRSLVLVLAVATGSAAAQGLGTRQVKVSVEFRQSGSEDRDALQGGLIIVERGGTAAGARLGADSRTTKVTRSSGIFTVVQDGGDASLRVAAQVPVEDVRFYRDYATGAGYVARGVVLQDVGTSLKVHAEVLAGDRIRLRLVPSVSYLSADGSGTIDFTDAATELVVENGRPVMLGGGTTRTEEVTRRILGYGARRVQGESTILLTAVLQ